MEVEPGALTVQVNETAADRAAATVSLPPRKPRGIAVPAPYRNLFVWAQVVAVFTILELALWAPTAHMRNIWAVTGLCTILTLTLADRPSLQRLGLRLPKTFGASVVLGIGFLLAVVMVILVDAAGGDIPANQTWPDVHSVWGYVIWSLMQEFILQSFFFTRFEELYGGEKAVWIAASLFAVAHLPSPVLTTATLIGALFFCEMFRRFRSIYFLGVVHAMLGLTIAVITPDSLLHHMRVGLGYLQY
jgi:membrane protease YdiL (CAAX protease family)